MASTRQSALEYITNGRQHLIGKLKNLPLIVENLFQRKVLNEEEVSKIQAEVDHFDQTRKILDWVSAKGEVACYELLTILDITRKRTLDNADLKQWISYFPFKDDPEMTDYFVGSKPCHGYQTQLKCKARKITEGAWKHSCSLLPDRCRNGGTFSYTPLVLDTHVHSSDSKIKVKSKRCKKARPKKLKSFIPLAKQETSPAELLKTHEKILLVGKPGIGKTSVSHQMLNLWAEKDHRELDYMFYFEVRDISHRKPMSLEDLLFNMYSEPNESKEEVLQDIKKNSENVVIIFDGITDLSSLSVVKDLVENLLPDAKIVTTCRPDQSEDFLTDWPTDWFRVEVKGFSDESIRAYLTQMLSAEPDSLSSVLNNLELFSLCHVPMYALMVVACSYYSTLADSKQPCSTTKMYINILRHCIQKHSGKRLEDHNKCLIKNREKILSLAEIAFDATNEKNMNLTTLSCEEGSVHFAFLGAFMVKVEPTASDTCSAFLHYTMQEFFGALWLLQNPDKIREVLEKCPTEEWKHTKHLIPFLCGLLNERNTRLVNSLVPAEQIKKTSDWFFKEVVNTFLPSQTNQDHVEGGDPESEKDLLFLCQCLYEYQSTEACLLLLDKLDYHLDLSGEHLDPHQCCAVSYVTSQSAERKVGLDLNGCTVSDQGVRLILGSLKNVRHLGPSSDDSSDPSMLYQLWTTLLSSETEMDFTTLLGLRGKELHLPVQGERRVFERAEEVMKQSLERVNLCLHWDQRTVLSEALSKTILKCLPNINKLRFTHLQHQRGSPEKLETEEKAVLLDLCLQAALDHRETSHRTVNTLLSQFSVYQTERYDILLDLYSHVKYNRNQTARSILPSLNPLYQSASAVWSIDLSERKASLLLEVLKLQPEKKPVELNGWSDEESEVRSFLQCLPYISQLSFTPPQDQRRSPEERTKREKTFLLNLCLQAALHERGTIQTTVEKVLSLSKVYHNQKCDFLLDLYSHVKDYETQTGRSVLPALQPVYQSAPAVWSIDLSERKASLLLEVLKLQPEKKPVELKGWSDEESEVRSFLQCLPYISQLRFPPLKDNLERTKRERTFLLNLCLQAALHERGTIQTTVEKVLSLSEVYHNQKCDFLLDLYSHVKDYETQTGRSVLPALQPVYQSAPAVWSIDLSERKASLLLEVLKLQPEKKPVELKGWSDEESEVRSFLQCLPYISQLRLNVGVAVKLSRLVMRIERGATPLTVPELSLVLKSSQTPERVLSRALSNVVSLLRLWRVQCLDLTDLWIQGHSLIALLCHQGPLSLRLNSETLQQLTVVVYEAQDKELTQWFLEKVGGDLTSCRMDWEVLLSLLQHSTHNITVDLRKNRLLEKNISDLLPFLGRVTLKRSSSSFVKSTIRQIYDRASECVSSLLSSSDHWINLNSRELDRVDCTALCFTLQHSHQVKVNLLWTSIPPGEIESILPLLDRVSQLSVDRRLLLSFLQCCAASQFQQGGPSSLPTAVWLLRSLHFRLDFSCSASVDMSVQDQEKALCLTTDHCKAINSVLKQNQHGTPLVQNQVQLILRDCEVEDRALRELLPILHIVKLSPSKALLLQLLDLVCEGIEEGLLRHAESLCRALDGELDLSETRLDLKACGSLALVLEHSEGLSKLDLSHCQLTDDQLQPLITHLHKVQVLDLSHNDITDALTDRILQLVSTNTSIHTIRLFNNRIRNRTAFLTDERFEI
ncbi:protein NLRC5-like [Oncorhynchus clarkii lewisi]|uniref:protein NLRC5-like n=1 Tax=Oncorhynchus clarkii lewisi TaxID=490388 RepID=UPI0039B8B513